MELVLELYREKESNCNGIASLTLDSDGGSVRDGSSETGSTGVDSSLRW